MIWDFCIDTKGKQDVHTMCKAYLDNLLNERCYQKMVVRLVQLV